MADHAAERLVWKSLFSLPTPMLRLLSGGGVVYQGGRTLDARFQFIANAARRMAQPLTPVTPEMARTGSAQALAGVAGKPEPGVASEDLAIEGPRGPIPLRAYRPKDQHVTAPVMVFAHFGGGVVGDLATSEVFCTILASIVRCAVVSVDYRLAPEHRFPAGLEDVLAAYRWVRDHADRFGAPVGEAMIGGDSMGGNFAAVIPQELKRADEPQPALQLMIYPAVDMASETQSMTTYADAYPMSRSMMEWFAGHYMGPDADPADPRLSPIKTADLSGLAPAVVITAGFDPLVDQGQAYARRLRDAGVPTFYRCYDALPHAFTAFTGAIPAADTACREIAGLVRESLEGRL